ncbi:MAG TPA: hypothetical protein VHJ20_01765 [Polyangia bacterium]|nr:hypothetical protein [Polyangia bacterium]
MTALSCAKGGSGEEPGAAGRAGANTGSGGDAGAGGVEGSGGAAGGGPGGDVPDAAGADSSIGGGGATGGSIAGGGGAGGRGAAGSAGPGGAAGSGGMATAGAGGLGGSSGLPAKGLTGMRSAGCTKSPVGAVSTSFTNHRIAIPACAPCTVPNCPSNCVAPPFVPGGINAQMAANGETFVDREFTIELPGSYDPDVPTAVFYGADGCGPTPPLHGAAFSVPGENAAIKIGLQQVGSCFADGGVRCAPQIANVGACLNGPEIPYFLAVQAWVEANFCVDRGAQFIGGGSSGAWESLLVGCAAATTMRGFYTLAGGLREHRWACNGPAAAFLIASDADTANPVGPLATLNVTEDTFGMAPARDEILARNGCVGKATAPFDPKFPSCVKYTGCPATYPVVWCEFPGGSHDNPTFNNVNYLNAVVPFFMSLPPAP